MASAGARTARSIAYWQFDTTGVGIFSLINNTDALYPVVTRNPYPKVGTTNSAVRIGVVSAEGGHDDAGCRCRATRATTTSRGWSGPDASTVAIQQLNRLQNQQRLAAGRRARPAR